MDAPIDVLLQHWPGVLFRQAADLRFEFLGPRIADWTGHPAEAFLARPGLLFECIHGRDVDALRARLGPGPSPERASMRFRFRHATTGRVTHVSHFRRAVMDASGAVKGWEGFWQDETRLSLAERRLESAAWKEALSELTGGFTHDFNNVLGGVHSLSDSFLSQIEPGHPFHEGMALMKRDTRRAGQLVQRLQQLHSNRAGQRAYHDLNALVTEAAELLRRGLSKRVEIVTELAQAQLPIHANSVELQRVIVALVLNAVEATPGSGRVVLRTHARVTRPLPEGVLCVLPGQPAGVCLSVDDGGSGFTEHQLAAMLGPEVTSSCLPATFKAGFTTRPASLGFGVGLLQVQRFAERHGGVISVKPTPGGGASVHVWLPVSDFTEADVASGASAKRVWTILLAGQPASALSQTAAALQRHDFRVVVADETIFELLASPDHEIDALMVRASPEEFKTSRLVDFIRRHRLPLKVFVQPTGSAADALDPELIAKADATFAQDLAEERFVEKLRKALAGA